MPQKSVTAVLVSYNSAAVIRQAVAALEADPLITNIIVVDNASKDNSREILRQCARVQLIESKENVGFGNGANMALQKVETPYALLVNPDAIMNGGALDTLLDASERYPDAAILTPALYDEQDKLHISYKKNVFAREQSRGVRLPAEGELCCEYTSGAVMLFNMALMKKIGFFDPNLFLYYEDDDICLRARAAGYSVVYVPQARSMHLMGESSGAPRPESEQFKQMHMIRSRLYIEEKYRGSTAALLLAGKLQKQYALRLALYRLKFDRMKIARYKGRLEGIALFTAQNKALQAA